jgi:Chaperone of endosialidase
MGSIGSDQSSLGGSTGGVVDANGALLLSTDTTGETSLMFGPSALREVLAGVANGDIAVPPADPTAILSDVNPLPYWTFTDVNSSGAITASVVADSTVASGNLLRFTIASGTTPGKIVTFTRFIPIPSSASRSFSVYAEASLLNATNSYEATAKLTGQFYKNDLTTTTGSSFNSATTTFQQFVTVYGLNAPDLYAIAPDLTTMTAPADAAFCKLTLTIATATLAVSNVARTLTTATITTSTFHNYVAGQSVTIALTSGPTGYAALNGTWIITSPVTSNTFTFTTVTSGTITSGAAVGTASSPSTVARTIDLTEVRLAKGLPELLLTDKVDPATYAPGMISEESGYLYVVSGSQDYISVGANLVANSSASISLNTGGTVSANAAALTVTTSTAGDGTINAQTIKAAATTTSKMLLQANGADVIVQDTNAADGTNPRIIFRPRTGADYAGLKSGAVGVLQVLSGSTSTTYGQLWAARVYPMNGSTASRYIYDDGNQTVFSGPVLANGVVNCDTVRSTAIPPTTNTTNAAIWVVNAGSDYTLKRNSSSQRYKTNIRDTDEAVLTAAKNIKPKHYESTIADEAGETRLGFIAEEVLAAGLSHAVGYDGEGRVETIDATALVAALYARVNDLETRLKALEEK